MFKIGILIRWLVFSAIFLVCTAGLFFHFILIPAQEKALHSQLLQRAKLILDFYRPWLVEAVQKAEDISLLKTLEAIKKDPDFLYVRLIDPESKCLAHDKIAEWNKVLNDPISQKIVQSSEPLELSIPEGYDLSFPILKEGKKIFSISAGISRAAVDKEMVFVRKQANLNSLIFIGGGLVFMALAFLLVVTVPLKKLQFAIQSVVLGHGNEKVELNRRDEFGEIGRLVNELIEQKAVQPATSQAFSAPVVHAGGDSYLVAEKIADSCPNGVIVLNADQNLLYANKIAADIFETKLEEMRSHHILEFINDVQFITLLKSSYAEPGATFEKRMEDKNLFVKLSSVSNADGSVVGTLIFLDRRTSA